MPAELPVKQEKEEGLDAGDLFVFDEIGCPQGGKPRGDCRGADQALSQRGSMEFRDAFDVEIEQVVSEDTQGKIGAGVVGSAVVNGMEGVEGDEVELSLFAEEFGKVREVGQIAATPVTPAAQRRQEAIDAVEGTKGGREVTAVRGEDPADFGLACGGANGEVVVTGACKSSQDGVA